MENKQQISLLFEELFLSNSSDEKREEYSYLSCDVTVSSDLFSLVSCFVGRVYLKRFRSARACALSSFFLVWWFIKRRDFTTERERERFKLHSKSYPLLVVVGLNKDEFYLEHDHHPFGVVAVFDATSCFVDE